MSLMKAFFKVFFGVLFILMMVLAAFHAYTYPERTPVGGLYLAQLPDGKFCVAVEINNDKDRCLSKSMPVLEAEELKNQVNQLMQGKWRGQP